MLRPLLLGVVRRLGPDAALEVDLRPLCCQHLAYSGTSKELQPHSIGSPAVRMRRQDTVQPFQLVVGQPTLAALLMERSTPLTGLSPRMPQWKARAALRRRCQRPRGPALRWGPQHRERGRTGCGAYV